MIRSSAKYKFCYAKFLCIALMASIAFFFYLKLIDLKKEFQQLEMNLEKFFHEPILPNEFNAQIALNNERAFRGYLKEHFLLNSFSNTLPEELDRFSQLDGNLLDPFFLLKIKQLVSSFSEEELLNITNLKGEKNQVCIDLLCTNEALRDLINCLECPSNPLFIVSFKAKNTCPNEIRPKIDFITEKKNFFSLTLSYEKVIPNVSNL